MSDSFRWDFFVSYVPSDERWGEWITQVLQTAHYEVASLDYAQQGRGAFLHVMQYSRRLLPVLSPASTNGATPEESAWQQACFMNLGRVVPIIVTPCAPSYWLELVTPIDLTSVALHQAADLLLVGIKAAVTGERIQPHKPPFPGDS